MLTLKRKPGQSIQIGRNISITVVKSSPTSVTLAIDAPVKTNVIRGELLCPTPANQRRWWSSFSLKS